MYKGPETMDSPGSLFLGHVEEVGGFEFFVFFINILWIQVFCFGCHRFAVNFINVAFLVFLPIVMFMIVWFHPSLPYYVIKFCDPKIYAFDKPAIPVLPIMLFGMIFMMTISVKYIIDYMKTKYIDAYYHYPELLTVSAKLSTMLERSVFQPILSRLIEDDRRWKIEAACVGYEFTTEYQTVPSSNSSRKTRKGPYYHKGPYGVAHKNKEPLDFYQKKYLSIFNQHLPEDICPYALCIKLCNATKHFYPFRRINTRSSFGANVESQTLEEAWKGRQELERFIVHPEFSQILSRRYIIDRYTLFRNGGLQNHYNAKCRDPRSGISDAHIITNVLIKLLNRHNGGQFSVDYMYGIAQPMGVRPWLEYFGILKPHTYLKLVPHGEFKFNNKEKKIPAFEVVTGNGKIMRTHSVMDAFALFFCIKAREGDLADFPRDIREIMENVLRTKENYVTIDVLEEGFGLQ